MTTKGIKITRTKKIENSRLTKTYNEHDIVSVKIDEISLKIENPYPLKEITELEESIKQYGLEQNLVVKQKGSQFVLVSGHRRLQAIKNILKEDTSNQYTYLRYVNVKVTNEDEDDIVSNLRKHESNTNVRSLLQLSEEEKLKVVDDYMKWINLAREKKVEVNGKPIKGKTRDLIAKRFGISQGTAQNIIKDIRSKEKGTILSPSKKEITLDSQMNKLIKRIEKDYYFVADNIEKIDENKQQELKTWLKQFAELI